MHKSEEVIIQIAAITYNIWFSRNLCVFEDRWLPEMEIIQRAYSSISDFKQANLQPLSTEQPRAPTFHNPKPARAPFWKKPETPFVKANSNTCLQLQGW